MSEDDRETKARAEKTVSLGARKRAMTLETRGVEYKFNDIVRSHTDRFFGKKHKEMKHILHEFRLQSQEITNLEDAKLALGKVMEQEQKLSHALSRTQMMLSYKEDMFEKAVEIGEQYKKDLEDLSTQIEEYEAQNSSLRADLKSMNVRHLSLKETIDDQQVEIASLIKAINLKDSVIANSSATPAKSESLSMNLGLEKIESEIQGTIKQLHLDLESEKHQRIDLEDSLASALSQLTDIRKELKYSRAKVTVLERKLKESNENYGDIIISLSTEKAAWKNKYSDLLAWYSDMEENFHHQMQSVDELMPTINISESKKFSRSESTLRSSRPLYDQMSVSRVSVDEGHSAIWEGSVFTKDTFTSISKKKSGLSAVPTKDSAVPDTKDSAVPDTKDVIQEYLHITAAIVKLHFPDLKNVASKWLIDNVKNSPFYLYHDLMMNCMHQLEQKEAADREEEPESAPTALNKKIDDGKQSGWISRFLKLTQGKPKTKGKFIKI